MNEFEVLSTARKLLDDLRTVQEMIDQAAQQAKIGLRNPDLVSFADLSKAVLHAQAVFGGIEYQVEELTHLMRRMATQRDSSITAFVNGWECGIMDLQDKLTRNGFDALSDALKEIEKREREESGY